MWRYSEIENENFNVVLDPGNEIYPFGYPIHLLTISTLHTINIKFTPFQCFLLRSIIVLFEYILNIARIFGVLHAH
jgi:hypothetical protein